MPTQLFFPSARVLHPKGAHRSSLLLGRPATLLVALAALTACSSPPETSPTPEGSPTQVPGETQTPQPVTPTALPPTPTQVPTPTPDPASLPCQQPLELSPQNAIVAPLALITLEGSGGTGAYRFSLDANDSGALINELTGAYLAGMLGGSTDIVRLTDDGCADQVTTEIQVADDLELLPNAAELPPGTSVQLEVTGGSGEYVCTFLSAASGGSLEPSCLYQAGVQDGTDLIRVEDLRTGQFTDSSFTVKAGAVLSSSLKALYLPVGAEFAWQIAGGSGTFSLVGDDSLLELSSTRLIGRAPGALTVVATDRFTHQQVTLPVTVIVPTEPGVLKRMGEQADLSSSLTVPDLNGDGQRDFILGVGEVSVDAYYSGGVYVYHSQRGGPPSLVQRFSGADWEYMFGVSLAYADFDLDGLPDLAVGARDANLKGNDSGGVYCYAGRSDGTFDSEPFLVLTGAASSDRFGNALASGDFNGDGLADLAVSAYNDEDNTASSVVSDQGAIHLFLGTLAGLPPTPDQVVYGKAPDGQGGWENRKLKLASSLASGDFDGDGLDDLAAGVHEYDDPATSSSSDGAVLLFAGVAPQESSVGGISTAPALFLQSTTPGNEGTVLGLSLAMNDADGDGRADLLVGQYNHRPDPSATTKYGAARLLLGRTLDTPSGTLSPIEDADWTVLGVASDDSFGWRVRLEPVDDDDLADPIVMALNGEITGGASAAGTVQYYFSKDGGLPGTLPTGLFAGTSKNEYFGAALGALSDQDGDDVAELYVFASRDDSLGTDAGRPWYLSSAAGTREALDFPAVSAGQQLGTRVAFLGDVTGDGLEDFIAGAPSADWVDGAPSGGVAWLYPGQAGQADGEVDASLLFASTPSEAFTGYPGHATKDANGYSVFSAGDFDGDGALDLAVLTRGFTKPSSFDASLYANPTECPGQVSDGSAIWIYRGSVDGNPPSSRPAFAYFGAGTGGPLAEGLGRFDLNGDGYGDLFIGAPEWNNGSLNDSGAALLLKGRARDVSGKILVLCQPDQTLLGGSAGDRLGDALAVVGDLDSDGCDEVAIGAYSDDVGSLNEGSVRVIFGSGSACATNTSKMIGLSNNVKSAQEGISLAGGADVDGDGLPDLVVGSSGYVESGLTVGAAWLVRSGYLKTLTKLTTAGEVAPADLKPLAASGTKPTWKGSLHNEGFPTSLVLLPGMESDGRALVAGGSLLSNLSGVLSSGAVRILAWDKVGGVPEALPRAILSGETAPSNSYWGNDLSFGWRDTTPVLLVGAPRADAVSPDLGAVYAISLSRLRGGG